MTTIRRISFAAHSIIAFFILVNLTGCQAGSSYTSLQTGFSASADFSCMEDTVCEMQSNTLVDVYAEEALGACFLVTEGKASYYAHRFHGRTTANGERFNMHELTAAHKSLPFGSRVIVTNLANGKKVLVRINDRGPYIKGRIIDLSLEAAKEIDLLKRGVTEVRIEAYEDNTIRDAS